MLYRAADEILLLRQNPGCVSRQEDDLPDWLLDLVEGVWEEPEWAAWVGSGNHTWQGTV
jgi:hypothetical protein